MSTELSKLQVIEKARNLLHDVGWTKGYAARDERGEWISHVDEKATCFCIIGAVRRAGWELAGKSAEANAMFDHANVIFGVERVIENEIGKLPSFEGRAPSIPGFNDDAATSLDDVDRVLLAATEVIRNAA